jgi:outer membrane protein, heavy metal efflux system
MRYENRTYGFMRKAIYAASIALVVALTVTPSASAQSSEPAAGELRLGEVFVELRDASPRLAAADALARASAAAVSSAGLPPDPQLQLGLMNYRIPGLTQMEPLGMVQLQLMQMLPLGGKLGLSKEIASSRASAQRARAGEVWWETRAEAAMVFYELYQTDRVLSVMRETLRLLANIRQTAESMYRVGEGRQADVLRAQVEIARMTEDTLRMQAMRDGLTARLNSLLDREPALPAGIAVIPAFPADVPALDSLQELAYRGRQMLKAAEDDLRAAERMDKLARRELFPDLQVGVQLAQGKSTMTAIDAMGDLMIERRTERMGSLMIGATIPVFARSRQLKMREEATAMRQMANAELSAMRAETRARLGESHAALLRARRLTALYRNTILPQSQAAYSSALSAYRVGSVDFMTLLDNQMTVNRYRQELHVLEAEEGKAWAELEMLLGTELLDSNSAAPTQAAGGAR